MEMRTRKMDTKKEAGNLDKELSKLRQAIIILAEAMGEHLLTAQDVKKLQELLKSPDA
jgi:hypothetical protein